MVEKFIDNDDGYLNWIKANPTGYVVNCDRYPRAAYLVLHRATCRSISGKPTFGERWTTAYIKVCSLDRHELESWARREIGGELRLNCLCNP